MFLKLFTTTVVVLSFSIKLFIFKSSKQKQEIAAQDVAAGLTPILIDDRKDIIERWNGAGGIGLHVEKAGDPSKAIQRIKKLYQVEDEGESSKERI